MGTCPKAASLPSHGRIACSNCYAGDVAFNLTTREGDGWRIAANPLAWGSERPAVVVLGFSKGPTQAGAIANGPHDNIPFKGVRDQAYKILAHLGLVPGSADPARAMERLLMDRIGRFAFGSFIRCTVSRWDDAEGLWLGTGGNMLDRFVATPFGGEIARNCATTFLGDLPGETKLVVMYGLGARLGYVNAAERIIRQVRPGTSWRRYDDVSYGDDGVTFVHTEHFSARGPLVRNWLGATDDAGNPRDPARHRFGTLAAAAVSRALAVAA